jgi:lambda family phage portal protein
MSKASILNWDGNPLARQRAEGSAFRAADTRRAEMFDFAPSLRSIDGEWLPERNISVARLRKVVRENGWASAAVQRFVDQAIGANFRLQPAPDHELLGVDVTEAHEWARQTGRKFRAYANDPRCPIDAAGRRNYSGLLALAARELTVSGEALAVVRDHGMDGFRQGTAIELVDADRLSNPNDAADTDRLRRGVERDAYGRPVAYHFRCAHPGDVFLGAGDAFGRRFEWERVAAVNEWGRRQVLHHFEDERPDQTRGIPALVATVEPLAMEDNYKRVELQAAVINAVLSAYIVSPLDHDTIKGVLEGDADDVSSYNDDRIAFHETNPLKMNGARIPHLYPGEDIRISAPSRANAAMEGFLAVAHRNVASAVGQSYPEYANDWASTNYSSIRAAAQSAWKHLTARGGGLFTGFGWQIYLLWLEEAFATGEVDRLPGAPSFYDAPYAWGRAFGYGPGRGWVDPTKEAQAAIMRMDAGISSLQKESAEQGHDWEELAEQQAFERKRYADLGLPTTSWAVISETAPEDEDADKRDTDELREAGASAFDWHLSRLERIGRRAAERKGLTHA